MYQKHISVMKIAYEMDKMINIHFSTKKYNYSKDVFEERKPVQCTTTSPVKVGNYLLWKTRNIMSIQRALFTCVMYIHVHTSHIKT